MTLAVWKVVPVLSHVICACLLLAQIASHCHDKLVFKLTCIELCKATGLFARLSACKDAAELLLFPRAWGREMLGVYKKGRHSC